MTRKIRTFGGYFEAFMESLTEGQKEIVRDYDVVLDKEFGAPGTPERAAAEEQAFAFYSGQIIRDVRKGEKVTQSELASRIGTTKSYISKIENGTMTPSVSTFYRIVGALGFRVEITRPMA